MNNNIYLERIRRNLLIVSQYFDPEKSSYSILKNCASSKSAEEMLSWLNRLGETRDFPNEFRNFFYEVDVMLKDIIKIDQEISNALSVRDEKYQNVKDEYAKRGMEYNVSLSSEDYLGMSYVQKKEYLDRLNKQLELVDVSLDQGIKKEKKLGNEYDAKVNEMANVNNSNDKRQIDSIQRMASSNFKIISNPDENFVFSILSHFRDNQKEGSKLNIDIDYSNSSAISLVIGYKGNSVDEREPAYKCVYSDLDYFNSVIRPVLLSEHVIDEKVNSNVSSEELNSENSVGETISVKGDSKEVMDSSEELNSYVDGRNDVRKNKNVKVRKFEMPNNYNGAFSNGVLFFSIVMVVLVLVVIVLLIFNFK